MPVDRTHRNFGWLLVSRTGGIRTGLVVIDDVRVNDGKIVPVSEIMFRMRSVIFLKLHPYMDYVNSSASIKISLISDFSFSELGRSGGRGSPPKYPSISIAAFKPGTP